MGKGRRVKQKEKKEKKKKKKTGKVIFFLILFLIIGLGAYLGYSIHVNGGGIQGVLATMLGQNVEKLEDVDTINVLVLRSEWRYKSKTYRHNNGMLI